MKVLKGLVCLSVLSAGAVKAQALGDDYVMDLSDNVKNGITISSRDGFVVPKLEGKGLYADASKMSFIVHNPNIASDSIEDGGKDNNVCRVHLNSTVYFGEPLSVQDLDLKFTTSVVKGDNVITLTPAKDSVSKITRIECTSDEPLTLDRLNDILDGDFALDSKGPQIRAAESVEFNLDVDGECRINRLFGDKRKKLSKKIAKALNAESENESANEAIRYLEEKGYTCNPMDVGFSEKETVNHILDGLLTDDTPHYMSTISKEGRKNRFAKLPGWKGVAHLMTEHNATKLDFAYTRDGRWATTNSTKKIKKTCSVVVRLECAKISAEELAQLANDVGNEATKADADRGDVQKSGTKVATKTNSTHRRTGTRR